MILIEVLSNSKLCLMGLGVLTHYITEQDGVRYSNFRFDCSGTSGNFGSSLVERVTPPISSSDLEQYIRNLCEMKEEKIRAFVRSLD